MGPQQLPPQQHPQHQAPRDSGLTSQAGATPGTAAAAGPQDPQQPGLMQNAAADRGTLQVAMVSYENSYRLREDPPAVAASLLLNFDVGALAGQPQPLPQRLTAQREGRFVREEMGLYRERQCILSQHSLNKTEQRIARAATLDKALLAEMAGGNAEAAMLQAAFMSQQQQQQLTVGALPTVTEEPDGGEGQQPQLLQLPPAGNNPQQQQQQQPQLGQTQLAALQQPMQGGEGLQQQQLGMVAQGGQMVAGVGGMDTSGAAATIQDPMFAYQWLDENGLMVYVPDPLKHPGHERPARRYDQDKELMRTYVRRPVAESAAALRGGSRLYRLDIELGRLEFLVHPGMAQEDLLAARLLALFREFKRREAVGLVMFYANRLAALEDSLLGAREKLFALQATEAAMDDVLDAYAMLGKIEREVAEMRQLKEEEEALLSRTVHAMERLYGEIQTVRQSQGYALTNLELSVVAKPPQELAWKQGVLTRERLDALLVAAEMEEVAGLPRFPDPLPVPDLADLPLLPAAGATVTAGLGQQQQPLRGPAGAGQQQQPYVFRLRRCESMCAAHAAIAADLTARLEVLKNRPSADPADPTRRQLEEQVALVGRAPRRVAMTAEEQMQLQIKATEMAKTGQIFVSRMPTLVPVLTISPTDAHHASQQQQQQGQMPHGAIAPLRMPQAPPKPSHKQGGKGRYYVKLFVNGHYVDSSDVAALGDNFVTDLKDTFSVQVSRFPESISVQLFERNPLRDSFISQIFIAIPGQAGSPHVDPQPRPYQFTALSPFRTRQHLAGPGSMPLMPDGHQHDPFHNYQAVFPSGAMYVRCGWVSERVLPGSRLGDTVLQQHAGGSAANAATLKMTMYENPLADQRPTGQGGHHLDSAGGLRPADIESGRELMPPVPSVPVDRMLRRAAERIGGKANRAQIMRWLSEHVIDPNDPRNAPLLELLKTQEAHAGALGEVFRLDIFPDVAMRDDRTADKRMAVLSRRWQAGIYRAPDKNLLKGVRSVPLRAPLAASETAQLDLQYLDQLALLEEASGGTQLALARVMMARHEKAMPLQIGAVLSAAVKEREERIRAFALRVRAAAARLDGRLMARRFRTEDVVNDAPLPQFKLELAAITQLLAPRRPLKRTKKLVKSLMTSVPKETQLMVTVQRAANLPARMAEAGGAGGAGFSGEDRNRRRGGGGGRRGGGALGGDAEGGGDAPSGAPDRLAEQRNCFVEVRFRSLTSRTVAVPGEFPLFNEQIDLDVFRDEGARDPQQQQQRQQELLEDGSALEPSPTALQANTDLITFNVFDEVIVEPSEPISMRRRPHEEVGDPVRLPERERRFLGCVRLPLSAVYQLQVLEGTFRLETPPVVLGYVQTSDRPATLSLHLTLRPRLAAPAGEVDERVTSGEQQQVNRHAQKWLAGLLARPECRSRVLKVMAVDADGAALLLCRYVAPTPLPPALAQTLAAGGGSAAGGGVEAAMLKLARFVAHVPYMEDSGLQKRRNDIWTSSSELLHLAGGDSEEHAHLLAGYFLQLGLQCFIVAGTSTGGARSHFVLTTGQPLPPAPYHSAPQAAAGGGAPSAQPHPLLDLNPGLLRLWNPVTGSVVSALDPTGEMREVGELYDGSNIWANTQPSGRPWEMRWNLGAPRDWAPFFGAALSPREIASVQTTPLYEELDARFYEELEARVEKRVEEALSNARAAGAFLTRPDNKVSRLLKGLLREMPQVSEALSAASLAASAALAEAGARGPTQPPQHLGERHKLITGLQASHNERIRREARCESAHGHMLALPFSDQYLEAVSEAVLNTGIHRIADDRAKFSTAVFVEPLGASFVCCIWIYVAVVRG
ncbi:hypothetical protein Agub_g7350 [Astrephomene gubernaculifera]|uniref:C2 domain-containing protein n=1 Tax=Astrephomene gubernaculifera TaxID=47775 RepID=A0AAD3DRK6_9CHLO|nr:hypothetical protein Agub_g7350 [Astrephomene gubernaculifera]